MATATLTPLQGEALWERQLYETEQSRNSVDTFSSGSISFVDSTVASEIWDATKGIVRESISANVELWEIVTGANERKASQKENPAQTEKLAEGRWIRQQNKDMTEQVRNVSLDRMRQMAMEALRISDGQMTINQVWAKANPNLTPGLRANETRTVSFGFNIIMDAWRGFREQKTASQKAQINQTIAPPGKNLTLNQNAHEGQASIVGPNAAPG